MQCIYLRYILFSKTNVESGFCGNFDMRYNIINIHYIPYSIPISCIIMARNSIHSAA
jgi:hypothetical protein